MGLITKEVDVELSGHLIKHFRETGYEIPTVKHSWGNTVQKGTTIKVKVSDLTPCSTVYVDVQCDHCGKILKRKYYQYTHSNHDGIYYCNKCSKVIFCSGDKNSLWNPDKTDEERQNGRAYPEYSDFIKKVLARDNYTCMICGKEHEGIEVHHLNGYNWFIEGRTDETNAVTLCHTCHCNFHSIYGRGNNTKTQFDEWIGNVLSQPLKFNGKLSETRMVYCIEDNKVYNDVVEAANSVGASKSSIYAMCGRRKRKNKDGTYEIKLKSVKGKHFLWYDEYLKMTESQVEEFLKECEPSNNTKVVCLTTNKVFNFLKEAAKYYNIKSASDILYCCKGKSKSAGKLPNGTKLVWMYYEDYLKLNKDNI